MPKLSVDSCTQTKRPRFAFGEYSDWKTGTVLLTNPIPVPDTMRATIKCARVYAVACSNAPMIMITTPMPIVFLRPRRSPMIDVHTEPRKQPTIRGQHVITAPRQIKSTIVDGYYKPRNGSVWRIKGIEKGWSVDETSQKPIIARPRVSTKPSSFMGNLKPTIR